MCGARHFPVCYQVQNKIPYRYQISMRLKTPVAGVWKEVGRWFDLVWCVLVGFGVGFVRLGFSLV